MGLRGCLGRDLSALASGAAGVAVQRRRQVPWRGIDLAMILAVYALSMAGVVGLGYVVLGPEATDRFPPSTAKSSTHRTW